MQIQEAIKAINQMQADRGIEGYAIGGAVGATFIALQTGRGRDKARVLQFIEADALDSNRFQKILSRHDLQGRWQEFAKQFLGDA